MTWGEEDNAERDDSFGLSATAVDKLVSCGAELSPDLIQALMEAEQLENSTQGTWTNGRRIKFEVNVANRKLLASAASSLARTKQRNTRSPSAKKEKDFPGMVRDAKNSDAKKFPSSRTARALPH